MVKENGRYVADGIFTFVSLVINIVLFLKFHKDLFIFDNKSALIEVVQC